VEILRVLSLDILVIYDTEISTAISVLPLLLLVVVTAVVVVLVVVLIGNILKSAWHTWQTIQRGTTEVGHSGISASIEEDSSLTFRCFKMYLLEAVL
jgi:hypothetical protein